MLIDLIKRLQAAQIEPDPIALAETLWLALHMNGKAETRPTSDPNAELNNPSAASSDSPTARGSRANTPLPTGTTSPGLENNLFAPPTISPPSSDDLLVQVPAAPALPGALALGRALRPFKRRVPARHQTMINVDATVTAIAEQRIWQIVEQPVLDRWLRLELIIDAHMFLWQQTIAELRQVLERLGAFTSIRLWSLDCNPKNEPILHAADHKGRPLGPRLPLHAMFIEPQRQVLAVVTDCIAPAWQQGLFTQQLAQWSKRSVVSIIQMLPSHLWNNTALRKDRRTWLSFSAKTDPYGLGRPIVARTPLKDVPETHKPAVLVPITSLEPVSLSQWASAISTGQGRVSGYQLTSSSSSVALANTIEARYTHFMAGASPMAQQLAARFAAAPLTLPIMRLIQQVTLPDSGQEHLAEVLFGGILRIANQPNLHDPDSYLFDFFEHNLRENFLTMLQAGEAIQTFQLATDFAAQTRAEVSAFIERNLGARRQFQAILRSPENAKLDSPEQNVQPFAQIGTTILRRLGGSYRTKAREIEKTLSEFHLKRIDPKQPYRLSTLADYFDAANHAFLAGEYSEAARILRQHAMQFVDRGWRNKVVSLLTQLREQGSYRLDSEERAQLLLLQGRIDSNIKQALSLLQQIQDIADSSPLVQAQAAYMYAKRSEEESIEASLDAYTIALQRITNLQQTDQGIEIQDLFARALADQAWARYLATEQANPADRQQIEQLLASNTLSPATQFDLHVFLASQDMQESFSITDQAVQQGLFDQALARQTQAIAIAQSERDLVRLIKGFFNRGMYYRDIGDLRQDDVAFKASLRYFMHAKKYASSLDHQELIGNCYEAMGGWHFFRGQLQKALRSYQQALGIFIAINHLTGHAGNLANLAEVYGLENDTVNLKRSFDQAVALNRQVKSPDIAGLLRQVALDNPDLIPPGSQMNPAQRAAFEYLKTHDQITINRYQQQYGVSRSTAKAALDDLVAQALLAVPEGTKYYVLNK